MSIYLVSVLNFVVVKVVAILLKIKTLEFNFVYIYIIDNF